MDLEKRKAEVNKIYGENQQITGDYDKNLSAKCINGTFVGKMDGDVLEFKGIPFVGEQPVGQNRWKPPVPFKEDDGVYEAYYFGKSPNQPEAFSEEASLYPQGEDCLYLNVVNNTSDKTPNKPVMVWIHGGAFEQGGTADPTYDPHNFVEANPDVIFVSITYRIGLLGFMRLSHLPDGEEYTVSQNVGLLDQRMALKWIHENIAAFGGDPNKICIFGESAGAASTSMLPLIDEAPKYFKRTIMESGSPVFTRSTEESIELTNEVLEALDCKTVADLLQVPREKFAEIQQGLVLREWPERDGIVLPKDPYQAYKDGKAKDIDFLGGHNKDELGYFTYCMGGPQNLVDFFGPRYEAKIATLTDEEAEGARAVLDEIAEEEYLKIQKFGDQVYFIAPAFRISENQTFAGGKVFQYYFTPESSIEYVLSGHAVEIPSVLNNLHMVSLTGHAFDKTFARTMQRMWVNFAKTGNPSLTAEESPTGKAIECKQYTSENKDIMVFDEFNVHGDTEENLKLLDWERTYPLTKYHIW